MLVNVDATRLRAMIAEDREDWRLIIARVIAAECEVVAEVERGDQVLESATRLRPDVVTLDISMPGQSGLQVLPALRSVLPDAVIIVVSAHSTSLYVEEALSNGADSYVPKSRVFDELRPAVTAGRRFGDPDHRRFA